MMQYIAIQIASNAIFKSFSMRVRNLYSQQYSELNTERLIMKGK